MELKDVISVSGMSGLYKVVAQSKNGLIVESLVDEKRLPVSASQRVSSLVDIAVYTKTEEMPLRDVMKKIQETDGAKLSVDPKADPNALKAFFKKIVPDFDEDRVYVSDIKKILTWYELLNGKIDFTAEVKSDDESRVNLNKESDKTFTKVHESHGPKADKHAKTGTVKLRKKV